jgi:hypothetical protein
MTQARPAAAVVTIVRIAAGPLVLLAFLLPWTHGPGALAGESYTGLDLVRLAGVLQGLHLPAAQAATLAAARFALVGLPVAAAWLTILGPAHRWHWGYVAAAAYLVLAASSIAAIGLIRNGFALPMPGPTLLVVASGMLLAPRLRLPATRMPGRRFSRRQAIPRA